MRILHAVTETKTGNSREDNRAGNNRDNKENKDNEARLLTDNKALKERNKGSSKVGNSRAAGRRAASVEAQTNGASLATAGLTTDKFQRKSGNGSAKLRIYVGS